MNINVYLKFEVLSFLWKLDFNIIFNVEFIKRSFKVFLSLSVGFDFWMERRRREDQFIDAFGNN